MGAATPANLPSPTALAGDYFSLVEVRGDTGEMRGRCGGDMGEI